MKSIARLDSDLIVVRDGVGGRGRMVEGGREVVLFGGKIGVDGRDRVVAGAETAMVGGRRTVEE